MPSKYLFRRPKEREELKAIYSSLTHDSGLDLSKEQFLSFLQDVQGVDTVAESARWTSEFNHYIQTANSKKSWPFVHTSAGTESMSFEAFSLFMTSPSCNVYTDSDSDVRFDRPLNEYFISTSHNTYLRGRQFAGDSSTEAYISALRRGCRCIEIDCWNGSDGRPIVTHGHTGTSHVLFADCVSVISRYAFEASPYPLILSLEVHCDAEQQGRMVQLMKNTFGEQLLLEPLHDNASQLPSPEELKYRILAKVKTSSPPAEPSRSPEKAAGGRKRSASSPYSIPIPLNESPSVSSLPSLTPASSTSSPPETPCGSIWSPTARSMTTTSASSAGEDSDCTPSQPRPGRRNSRKSRPRTSKISKPLADLGVYFQGYKYRNLFAPECSEYNHIFSLDETKAGKLCRDVLSKSQFEEHNLRYMFRVYPKGMRLDSSNFDPNSFWRRGVQMVALNWQTYDPCMQMNQAMFAAGADRYGYVLKPEYLRPTGPLTSSPGLESPVRHKLPQHLVKFSVEMISAQQLPRPRTLSSDSGIHPFVEIQMFIAEDRARGIASGSGGTDSSRNGYSGIGSPYGRRTNVVMENGQDPIFRDCFDLSLETRHPDLVFVRWIVWHAPNGKTTASNCRQLGVFTAKLSSLQQGYRHLPLYNHIGQELKYSSLFCKIHKEKSVMLPADLVGASRMERAGIMKTTVTALRRTLSTDREQSKRLATEAQRRAAIQDLVAQSLPSELAAV